MMAVFDPKHSEHRKEELKILRCKCTDYIKKLEHKGCLDELQFLTDVVHHLDEWKPLFDLIQRLSRKATTNVLKTY